MYQFQNLEDTIVAISTAIGQGGIGIVRLSGKNALSICDEMFVARNKIKSSRFKSHSVHYGWVIRRRAREEGREAKVQGRGPDYEIIDEALVTVMRAPRSYTKEDVIEISCHGGIVAVQVILKLAMELGARLAEPGEFTQRAFLNGRIDLTQAEAVLDIIQAKTDAFLKVSTHQLKGELSLELEAIRGMLMNIYTELEAIVNFPEDDIDASGRQQLRTKVNGASQMVEQLLKSSEQGRILKEGIKIVLCGKPNVGKSSLLNVLLKTPRAIVTAIAGTTRDTIEETTQIQGIPFQLVDTAGILEPRDLVEEEAIKRSHLYINSADLILSVLDGGRKISREDEELMEQVRDKNVLFVLNKSDLNGHIPEELLQRICKDKKTIRVSALKKMGVENLENALVENVLNGRTIENSGVLVSNIRHIQSLKECEATLRNAENAMAQNLSFEFVSEDIKSAINCLDHITGRNIDHDLLDKIFSEFCIGK